MQIKRYRERLDNLLLHLGFSVNGVYVRGVYLLIEPRTDSDGVWFSESV